MAYQVLARKYRPTQFDDVVGQEHVTRTLGNAIRGNRVAHAYLFVGPRGIGKTSIARIFAKALNCVQGPTEKPCDQCASCMEIAQGTSLDVQEIDGASNRGIDDVRALRETVKYAPNGRFKLIIIDEVHQVTPDAFNALLKTLEEPPAHLKFIFATTEPQKIPATILSRCQRFDLRRIPLLLLVERLKKIAVTEQVAVDDEALWAIARVAEGGLRDALSALDQLISFQGKDIHEPDVLAVFGLVSRAHLMTLSSALLTGDVAAVIRQVETLDAGGKDMQRLLVELLEHVRNLLILVEAGAQSACLDVPAAYLDELKTQAAHADAERLLRIADILMDTMDRLKYALSRKTLLETALIRCARAATTVTVDELLMQVRALSSGLVSGTVLPPAPATRAQHAAVVREPRPRHEAPAVVPAPAAPAVPALAPPSPGEFEHLKKEWHDGILARVVRIDPLSRGALLNAGPIAIEADKVIVGFDEEFPERMDQAQQPRCKTALQKSISELLHRPVTVEYRQVKDVSALRVHPPVPAKPAKSDDGAQAGTPAEEPSPTLKKDHRKWMADPVVQKTVDMFNGSIMEIRE